MRLFNRFDIDIDLDKIEAFVSANLRRYIVASLALLAFVTIIALTVFFITVRGAEQTLVPDVTGKELTQALLDLQAKQLYPRIQLRHSQSALDKGTILEQDPSPGSIVKAGRRIKLVVSRGVSVDKVENYVGQNLDDVKMHLQTLFSTSTRPLLSLKEPAMYQFSDKVPGTILEQKPAPGFEVSGPIQLEFIVSRGPERAMVTVPSIQGLSLADACTQLASSSVAFDFSIRAAQGNEKGGIVVSQTPVAGTVVPSDTRMSLVVITPVKLEEGTIFGLFQQTLPAYPYPLAVKVEALLPTGERRLLIASKTSGGNYSVPYQVPQGTVLILSVLNRETARQTVGL